jgi:glutamyl-tRNA reductase
VIVNLRVDHKIADIQSMESISKDIDDLFWKLQDKYSIGEYVEISTCNRKEYYLKNDYISEDDELLSHENQNIIIEYGESAVMHLLRMTSGLE